MATQAKVIIKGQNDIGRATKSAANDISSLKSTISKFGTALKSAFAVTAAVVAIQKLGAACKSLVTEDFGATNRQFKQLALALGDTKSYDSVRETVAALSKQTLSANGDIESMVAQLAALGKSSDEINSISTAVVSLSNVTGRDLNSSMTTLLNTYNGSTTQLKRLGINLNGVTKEQLAQGAAIDIVIDQLGEYSQLISKNDTSQHLKNMGETWGDIKKKIGGILDYNFGPWIGKLDTAFENIGTQISNIADYIGAIMKHFPEVFKLSLSTMWNMLKKTFEWDSTKLIFTTAIKNIGIVAGEMLKAVFTSIPQMVVSVASGIINWIAYIAMNIESSIISAVQNAINKTGNNIDGTWFGKIFKIGDKLQSIDLGGDELKKKAEANKEKADKSFENIVPVFKEALDNAIDSAKIINSNNVNALNKVYGGITSDFATALDKIVTPSLEEIKAHSSVTDQSGILSEIAKNTEDGASSSEEIAENTKEEKLSMSEKLSAFLKTEFGTLFSNILPSGEDGFLSTITSEMTGGISTLVDSIMPLANTILSVVNPFEIFLTIIKGFVSIMEPALNTVIAPLMDVFSWIGESLARVTLPLLDQLHVVFTLLSNVLVAVLAPIIQSLEPVFLVLSGILEALSPILLLVAKAFTILMSPVQFVADLFSWLGSWIKHLGSVISTAIYNISHPFSSKKSYGTSPGGFSSNAFNGLSDRLNNIDTLGDQDTTVTDSVATNTAVSSAGYSGATQVTINIYQQAPIVGDGGMRAFANMIKGEFEELNYYGVSI